MKKMILLCLVMHCISCQKDDTIPEQSTLDGSWSLLTYISSSILPVYQQYEESDIVWDFNTTDATIAIYTEDSSEVVLLEAGIYIYSQGENACNYNQNLSLVIDGIDYGTLIVDGVANGELQLSSACYDGSVLTFKKITR